MIKAVIIDDEVPARDNLKQIIQDNFSNVEIIAEADSVASGVQLLTKVSPDLVLLDINLNDGSGFNLLEQLGEISFNVIFVTAYDQYAIKAFQFNALDYVLKPIDIDQLKASFKKHKESLQKNYITKEELKIVLGNYSGKDLDKKLAVHELDKISYIPIIEITRIEADGNYSTLYFQDGTKKVTSKTLKTYEEILPKSIFCRIHQSNILNLNFIKEYNKEDGSFAVLNDGTKIAVSRRRKEEFITSMENKTI